MNNLLLKRKSIELRHMEAWLTEGKGSFHFENIAFLKHLIKWALKSIGMYKRGKSNAINPVVRNIHINMPKLPVEFDGFTLLHLSDMHIDGIESLPEVIMKLIEGKEVDSCVFTGDFRFAVKGSSHNVIYNMEKILGVVKAKYGSVGILGNHDFYDIVPEFERMGLKMLINDSVEVKIGNESIWIVGVDDPHYYGCDDLSKSLSNIPAESFKILLAHSPELYYEAEEANIDLYLCGHTHAGQICFPFIGPVLTHAKCPRRLCAGYWEYKSLRGYTSAGIGSSLLPVRFNCPPEITFIELKHNAHA